MKKRRALALLLALSLSVSMNGMTVLATAPGSGDLSVVTEEGSGAPGEEDASGSEGTEESGNGEQKDDKPGSENTGGETNPGDSSEDNETSKDENNGEDPDNKDESGDPDNKDDQNPGGEDNKDEENPSGGEGETKPGEEKPDEKDPDLEEDPDVEEPGEKVDESVSENTVGKEDTEELPEEENPEVRMESFTDATGMTITYDAVMAASFETEIRNGRLVAVPDAEGVVDLREEEITQIDAGVFKGNTAIKYIMLPTTVKTIGSSAFEGCSSLKGISIPSRLTEIGDSAFKGCTSLTQLALPNSVTTIGVSAFQGDSRLFMVHMISAEYSKLKTISKEAFSGCSSLEFFCSDEEYRLPDSITTIGENAFQECRKIKKVSMSDEITSLGIGAYQSCSGITEVSLSSGLAVISAKAFFGCTGLTKVTFGNNNILMTTEIAEEAFGNCSKLGNIELPGQIGKVCTNAFKGCRLLKRIQVNSDRTILDDDAFPNDNQELCLVGWAVSTAANYAKNAGIRFVATNDTESIEYYTYKQRLSGSGTETGQINLKITDTKTNSDSTPDINKITNGENTRNGVKAGTQCYIWITWGGVQGVQLVEGSMKCNGVPVTKSGGYYTFKMPQGGATITAEFELKVGSVLIEGNEDSVEGRLSTDANFTVKNKKGYGTLKVGQSTKFYLTNSVDGSGSRIPTSKVKYYVSGTSPKGIISVDKNGTVKALKAGTAVVCADVKNIEGDTISRMVEITVEQVKVDHISMLVTSYDRDNMTIDRDEDDVDKVIGISVPTSAVTKNYTFNLKASAFTTEDDGEALDVPFTWATSDAKVAKIAKTSTTAASSVNTITIPINTDGEATITVTATNADKTKVTGKFVVSVQNYKPRLTATKITINPNQVDGATTLGIISAYGKEIDKNSVRIIDAKEDKDYGDFTLEKVESTDSNNPVTTYKVSARDGLPDKTYAVRIEVKVGRDTYPIPLSIVVKKSVPNPKVSFAKTQKKINLFYAKDQEEDGTPIEIKPVISNLGTAEVETYSLEPLTEPGSKTYEDDAKFTENFEIKTVDGQPVITQKSENLACNKSKKAVVTGYLVMKFKDYKKNGTKKYKITIPTQTVTPAYVLDKTANTFGTGYTDTQEVYLQLLDKKTKKPIDLHPVADGETNPYKLLKWNTSTTGSARCSIVEDGGKHDGMIRVTVSRNPDKGRLVMKLTNSTWAEGKEFMYTYQVNTDTRAPRITLKTATVNINASYPEQTAAFELVSNQYDTVIEETQTFDPVNYERLSESVQEQYDKLDVSYENGVGTVSLVDGNIRPGTYRFLCNVSREGGTQWDKHNVTLSVRVTKTAPTVTLKGTNAFNLSAYMIKEGNGNDKKEFIEKSEVTFTTKNLPADYTFDERQSFDTIECTTRGYGEIEECFDFQWNADKNIMEISMKEEVPAKTYAFKMMPFYSYQSNVISPLKPVTFSIRVYNGKISVKLGVRGKINLVDRGGECTEKNAIRYTPTFANLKDTVGEVVILDASEEYPTYEERDKFISKEFEAKIAEDGKSFFVVPKDGVKLENRKTYQVRIWMKTKEYIFPGDGGGIYAPGIIRISTAEVLPKVKTDKTEVNLYLSSKSYKASFVVTKADLNAVGAIEEITFGEKDDKANGSFEITYDQPQKDGSLKVYLKLKNAVSYGCNTTNKVTMYIKFKDQGTNTAGTAINMNVKINK